MRITKGYIDSAEQLGDMHIERLKDFLSQNKLYGRSPKHILNFIADPKREDRFYWMKIFYRLIMYKLGERKGKRDYNKLLKVTLEKQVEILNEGIKLLKEG